MDSALKQKLTEALAAQKGHVGLYYKNLATGETFGWQAGEAFLAASVIKLPILCCIEKWAAEGRCSLEEKITVTDGQKEPICGALPLFTGDVTTDVRSLCRLMISLSDNTATNVLIDRYGIPAYEEEFRRIRIAQIARGADAAKSPLLRARNLAGAFAALFIGLFRHADSLAQAMDTRCYGAAPERTRLR